MPATNTVLRYRSFVLVEELGLDECTIHHASAPSGDRFWLLWWLARRETDGQPETFCVPIAPAGVFSERGVGGRTWGLSAQIDGSWDVSPSIHATESPSGPVIAPGASTPRRTIWHKTPKIVGVPVGESWASCAAP